MKPPKTRNPASAKGRVGRKSQALIGPEVQTYIQPESPATGKVLFERISLGMLQIGVLHRDHRNWVALGPNWQPLGTFSTKREAIDEIWMAHIADPVLALVCTPAASFALH
jgi:hypothetical protein